MTSASPILSSSPYSLGSSPTPQTPSKTWCGAVFKYLDDKPLDFKGGSSVADFALIKQLATRSIPSDQAPEVWLKKLTAELDGSDTCSDEKIFVFVSWIKDRSAWPPDSDFASLSHKSLEYCAAATAQTPKEVMRRWLYVYPENASSTSWREVKPEECDQLQGCTVFAFGFLAMQFSSPGRNFSTRPLGEIHRVFTLKETKEAVIPGVAGKVAQAFCAQMVKDVKSAYQNELKPSVVAFARAVIVPKEGLQKLPDWINTRFLLNPKLPQIIRES